MHSGLIYHEVSGAQRSSIGARNLKVYGHGYTEYFLCHTVVTRRKNTFHKIYHLSHSILNFSVVRPLKLGTSNKKRVEKDVFRFLTSLGQRKSSESP